ncbi:MAG: RluA family pseudouridine synthase [Bdellovibrionales bacterium]|nr:RluA family pseudouridine synthase [Bdellovibrionales bacterium]
MPTVKTTDPSVACKRVSRLQSALSSVYHCWVFQDQNSLSNQTVSEFYQKNLTHIPHESWEQRFAFGGTYINGRRANPQDKVTPPCFIEYYEPRYRIEDASLFYPNISEKNIIFRDDYLMVVFKPAKLPTTAAKDQTFFHLKGQLEDLTGTSVHLPSRLDTSVAGLVPVSINSDSHNRLQQGSEKRTVSKNYLLKVCGHPDWLNLTVNERIGRDPLHPVLRKVVAQGGRDAETHFQVILRGEDRNGRFSLILAKPVTGRTHQIRVHIAHLGFPIVGDNFYQGFEHEDLHLLSYHLELDHPIFGNRTAITAPEHLLPKWAMPALEAFRY